LSIKNSIIKYIDIINKIYSIIKYINFYLLILYKAFERRKNIVIEY